jgi:hypothetical protein
MRLCSWVPMFASMPHSSDSSVGRPPALPALRVADHRGRAWEPSQGSHVNRPKTSQPPWKSSTRAAVLPRPCWLCFGIHAKRLSLTVGRIGTPAFAGAWEDEQQLELKPCCLLPLSAIPVPVHSVSPQVSYPIEIFGDPMIIPKPQPRPFDTFPMTLMSGFAELGRRNLQG